MSPVALYILMSIYSSIFWIFIRKLILISKKYYIDIII